MRNLSFTQMKIWSSMMLNRSINAVVQRKIRSLGILVVFLLLGAVIFLNRPKEAKVERFQANFVALKEKPFDFDSSCPLSLVSLLSVSFSSPVEFFVPCEFPLWAAHYQTVRNASAPNPVRIQDSSLESSLPSTSSPLLIFWPLSPPPHLLSLLSSLAARPTDFPYVLIYGPYWSMEIKQFQHLFNAFPHYRIVNAEDSVSLLLSARSTFLGRIPQLPEACRRSGHSAVVSLNDHPDYNFYLPIIQSLWYHVLGYGMVVNFAGPQWRSLTDEVEEKADLALKLVWKTVQKHNSLYDSSFRYSNAPPFYLGNRNFSTRLSQLSRFFSSFHPEVSEGESLIQADADILPLSYEFFHTHLDRSKQIHLFNSECCGNFEFQDRGAQDFLVKKIRHFPMSYVKAKVKTFRKLIDPMNIVREDPALKCSQEELLWILTAQAVERESDSIYWRRSGTAEANAFMSVDDPLGRLWFLDELVLSRFLQESSLYPDAFDFVPEIPGRLDRTRPKAWNSAAELKSDAHLFRAGYRHRQWRRLSAILMEALPAAEFLRLREYVKAFQKIVKTPIHPEEEPPQPEEGEGGEEEEWDEDEQKFQENHP